MSASPPAPAAVGIEEVRAFLYHEAELLDEWQLRDWVALFTADGEYQVPATDVPHGNPGSSLFLIEDDRHRLEQRALRLLKPTAHAEFPHSRMHHDVTNVQIKAQDATSVTVRCNFVVYRSRNDHLNIFPGHAFYTLHKTAEGLRIRHKRAVLDTENLRLQNNLSVIL